MAILATFVLGFLACGIQLHITACAIALIRCDLAVVALTSVPVGNAIFAGPMLTLMASAVAPQSYPMSPPPCS